MNDIDMQVFDQKSNRTQKRNTFSLKGTLASIQSRRENQTKKTREKERLKLFDAFRVFYPFFGF